MSRPARECHGVLVSCGPRGFRGEADHLVHSNDDKVVLHNDGPGLSDVVHSVQSGALRDATRNGARRGQSTTSRFTRFSGVRHNQSAVGKAGIDGALWSSSDGESGTRSEPRTVLDSSTPIRAGRRRRVSCRRQLRCILFRPRQRPWERHTLLPRFENATGVCRCSHREQ